MLNRFIYILCLVGLIEEIAMTRSMVEARELRPPAAEFNRHAVVQPVLLHGRTKREISTTRDKSGEHHSEVTIKIPVNGEEYIMDLRLNQDLVTDNHVLSYQENGTTVVYKPKKEDMDLCHYSGSVRDKPNSWVTVSTCRGIQGIVFDGERIKYIEPAQGGDLNAEHYIYDHADLPESHPQRYNYEFMNSSQHEQQKSLRNREKRYAPNGKSTYRHYKANKRPLYVELAFVADREHFKFHNYDVRSVYTEMKIIANHVNAIYSPLNIYIALVGAVVWTDYDEIYLTQNSSVILKGFLKYRRTKMVEKNVLNDFAFLLTHQKFEDHVVGRAVLQGICTQELSGGVGNYYTQVTGLLAATVAHELGHNLGMHHNDKRFCECKERECIMDSINYNNFMATAWSSCSLTSLAHALSKGQGNCLRNRPNRLFDSPSDLRQRFLLQLMTLARGDPKLGAMVVQGILKSYLTKK